MRYIRRVHFIRIDGILFESPLARRECIIYWSPTHILPPYYYWINFDICRMTHSTKCHLIPNRMLIPVTHMASFSSQKCNACVASYRISIKYWCANTLSTYRIWGQGFKKEWSLFKAYHKKTLKIQRLQIERRTHPMLTLPTDFYQARFVPYFNSKGDSLKWDFEVNFLTL